MVPDRVIRPNPDDWINKNQRAEKYDHRTQNCKKNRWPNNHLPNISLINELHVTLGCLISSITNMFFHYLLSKNTISQTLQIKLMLAFGPINNPCFQLTFIKYTKLL